MDEGSLQDAIATAREILDGKVDVLNGCGVLVSQIVAADLGHDSDFNSLLGVVSKFNHLPIGPERQFWNVEVLRQKDVEIATVTAQYGPMIISVCHRLIERFEQA